VKSRRASSETDYETWIQEGVAPTLNAFDMGDTRATVLIIDGTRVGDVRVYEDEIMQTVISRWGTGGGNVPYVFPLQGETMEEPIVFEPGALGRLDGERSSTEVVHTLRAQMGDNHPAVAYDEYNDSVADTHHTLRAGTKQSTGAIQNAVVRRLTPIECERLQGFPDNWTLVDEKTADTHRYKQMGNAVTVNVIEWIGARL
jgi:site-specific DNA-cytosine methylase